MLGQTSVFTSQRPQWKDSSESSLRHPSVIFMKCKWDRCQFVGLMHYKPRQMFSVYIKHNKLDQDKLRFICTRAATRNYFHYPSNYQRRCEKTVDFECLILCHQRPSRHNHYSVRNGTEQGNIFSCYSFLCSNSLDSVLPKFKSNLLIIKVLHMLCDCQLWEQHKGVITTSPLSSSSSSGPSLQFIAQLSATFTLLCIHSFIHVNSPSGPVFFELHTLFPSHHFYIFSLCLWHIVMVVLLVTGVSTIT